ncbi:MAG: guanylate kinase [Puniceicoccales bacterium]|jgi:guanylate kinase|nr:guanylate kinase [Puniceicoccales bacterium]
MTVESDVECKFSGNATIQGQFPFIKAVETTNVGVTNLGRGPLVLIISGPAGAGKTTLSHNLVALAPERFARAVTTTTRQPRAAEKDGYDYYFVSRKRFVELLERDAFYEHAQVHGEQFYGLTKGEVERHFSSGRDVLLCMDVQGAAQLHRMAREDSGHFLRGRVVTIFLLPPNFDELRERVRQREPMPDEELERRMASMTEEMRNSAFYDYLIPPGTAEEALHNFLHIYHAEKMRGGWNCGRKEETSA